LECVRRFFVGTPSGTVKVGGSVNVLVHIF
jgi:hypothetical protein